MTAPWMKRKWRKKSLLVNSRLPDWVSFDVKEPDDWVMPHTTALSFLMRLKVSMRAENSEHLMMKSLQSICFEAENCGKRPVFNDGLWERESLRKLFKYFEKSQSSSGIPQNNCLFWQLASQICLSWDVLWLLCSFLSLVLLLMIVYLSLRRHTNTCIAICVRIPPKTLAETTEAVDCEQKDNSQCCCVGVTQLGFLIPTVWERGTARNRYKVQKPVEFLLSILCCSSDITYKELGAGARLPHAAIREALSLKNP